MYLCFLYFVISSRSYNEPLCEEELESLGHKKFSDETMKKVRWVTKMYREWRNYRHSNSQLQRILCDLDDMSTINEEFLTFSVCQFFTEVKKMDGSDFPGKTLYDIIICVQFHLETLSYSWKLLNEEKFKEIRFTLDNTMKKHTSNGIGVSV